MKRMVLMAVAGAVLGVGAVLATANTNGVPGAAHPSVNATGAAPQAAVSGRTATPRVSDMYCASCPFIVQRALVGTPGVISAEVSFRDKLAVVAYDGQKTDIAALIAATASVGYPADVVNQ